MKVLFVLLRLSLCLLVLTAGLWAGLYLVWGGASNGNSFLNGWGGFLMFVDCIFPLGIIVLLIKHLLNKYKDHKARNGLVVLELICATASLITIAVIQFGMFATQFETQPFLIMITIQALLLPIILQDLKDLKTF